MRRCDHMYSRCTIAYKTTEPDSAPCRCRSDEDQGEEEERGAGHKRKRGAQPAEDEFFRYDDMEAFLQTAEKQRDVDDEEASAGGSDEEDSGECSGLLHFNLKWRQGVCCP